MARNPRMTALTTFGITFAELTGLVLAFRLSCTQSRDMGDAYIEFTMEQLKDIAAFEMSLKMRLANTQVRTPGTLLPAVLEIVQMIQSKLGKALIAERSVRIWERVQRSV